MADREDDSYPHMPKGFTAYPKAGGRVELSWHPPEDSEVTGYRIWRVGCCIQLRDHRGFPAEGWGDALRTQRSNIETEWVDTNRPADTEYRYAVQWIDNKGTNTTSDDVYSALSFIYPVETLP